jgi:mitochondrial inner membrane protease subunit 2
LPPYPDAEVVVPEGHGWLEGDAPFNSEDSNHFGPVRLVFCFTPSLPTVQNSQVNLYAPFDFQVPLALVESKLTCVLWPLNRVGAIGSHPTGTQAERVVTKFIRT